MAVLPIPADCKQLNRLFSFEAGAADTYDGKAPRLRPSQNLFDAPTAQQKTETQDKTTHALLYFPYGFFP